MKVIPDHIFRGYDLRGIVGEDLDEERVEVLGKGYATWLLQRRIYECVVGFDCRISSLPFSKALIKGLTDSGVNVINIGMTLTQIAYFAQYYFRTRGMVMITASHNPKEYNGFKFATGYSHTMLTEDIQEFRQLVQSGNFLSKKPKGKIISQDVKDLYIDDIFRHVDQIGKFKIVVDTCAATAGIYLPDIFRRAGCKVIEQNTKPDGNFPVGTPDPTEKVVLERLGKRVLKEKANIGFTYDADGDRIGVVNEEGTPIWNDTLLTLFAQDVIDFLPGSKIIFNTLCSKQVADVVTQSGGRPIIWKTGHSFIKAKVAEEQAPFGGELSGHIYFVDNFYGHDDGAIASLRLLAYLTRKKKSLKQAIAELPHYISSPEIKVGCPDNIKFQLINEKIAAEIKKLYPQAEYVEIDGVRMDTDKEMLIIRASQNGPYITIKFEGKTQKDYNRIKAEVKELLGKFPEIDFSFGVNLSSLE